MHCAKDSIEIKGSIEIVLLILIVVLAVVSVGYFYAQKESQKTYQEIPLIKPTPPLSVNKAIAPSKAVTIPTQHQKTNTGGLPSEQKTAKPFQKNTTTVAESEKTIDRSLYSIRVGSFRSKDNVDRICKKLKQNGYEPSLETVTLSDNSTWYRVTTGKFKTREEAANCAKNMEEKEKITTMILKKN